MVTSVNGNCACFRALEWRDLPVQEAQGDVDQGILKMKAADRTPLQTLLDTERQKRQDVELATTDLEMVPGYHLTLVYKATLTILS